MNMKGRVALTPRTIAVAKVFVGPRSQEGRIELTVSQAAVKFSRHSKHRWGFDSLKEKAADDMDYVSVKESTNEADAGLVSFELSDTDRSKASFVSERPEYCLVDVEWTSERKGILKLKGLKRTVETKDAGDNLQSNYVKIQCWENASGEAQGKTQIGTINVVVLRELRVTVRMIGVIPLQEHNLRRDMENSLNMEKLRKKFKEFLEEKKILDQIVVKLELVAESYLELCRRISATPKTAQLGGGFEFDENGVVDMDLKHNDDFIKAAENQFMKRAAAPESAPDLLLFCFWKFRHLDKKGSEAHGFANVPNRSLVDDTRARSSCVAKYYTGKLNYSGKLIEKTVEHGNDALNHVIAHELCHLLGLDDVKYKREGNDKTKRDKELENNIMLEQLNQSNTVKPPPSGTISYSEREITPEDIQWSESTPSSPVFRFRSLPLKEGGTESQWTEIGRNGLTWK